MNITSAQLSSSHACNICNIEFDLRFDLRSHMQQHHNQKALQVPVVKKEEEVVKKLKQAKVEGKMPVLKKGKKISAVKVVKKVKKELFLTVKGGGSGEEGGEVGHHHIFSCSQVGRGNDGEV